MCSLFVVLVRCLLSVVRSLCVVCCLLFVLCVVCCSFLNVGCWLLVAWFLFVVCRL